jgi:hypothetical protein
MAKQYKEIALDSDIRPEYVRKLKRIQKEQITRIGGAEDFKKRYGSR